MIHYPELRFLVFFLSFVLVMHQYILYSVLHILLLFLRQPFLLTGFDLVSRKAGLTLRVK